MSTDALTIEADRTSEYGRCTIWFRWSCAECHGVGSWLHDRAKVERMAKAHATLHVDGEVRA